MGRHASPGRTWWSRVPRRHAAQVKVAVGPTVAALVVGLFAVTTLSLTPGGAAHAAVPWRSGAYCASADPACVNAFAAWRGRPVQVVGTYLGYANWTQMEGSDVWLTPWTANPYKSVAVITVPLVVQYGDAADPTPTLAEGATGLYDVHFVNLATKLVAAGMGSSVIRLGHEFNGSWYVWAAQGKAASFVAYWQHAVTAMRSVPGAAFTFDWNVANAVTSWDARTAYPGDAYVDTIGVDIYDQRYGSTVQTPAQRWAYLVQPGGTYSQGLQLWSDFAAAHSKPMSIPEWGLVNVASNVSGGGGGGDDPYFVQQMFAWMSAHPIAYEIYFNRAPTDGDHVIDNGHYPNAAAAYVSLLGDSTAALGPSPLPSPWPPVTPTPSDSLTPSDSGSPTDSPTSTDGATPTDGSSPTDTSSPTDSGSPSVTDSGTPTVSPTLSSSSPPPSSASPTFSPSISASVSASVSATVSASSSATSTKASSSTTSSASASSTAVNILLSTASNRSKPVSLSGRTVKGSIYVFVTSSGAKTVKFYFDDTKRAKAAAATDSSSPFDLAGNWTNGEAKPYATTKLSTGKHTLTVAVTVGTTTRVATVTFTVTR